MASTINATNTTSGVAITPDSSGILQLQTAGTTAVTVDASQNVGIGGTPSFKLDIIGTSAGGYIVNRINNLSATGYARVLFDIGASGANGEADISYVPGTFFAMGPSGNDTTSPIVFRNNNSTERMRIDSSGNVLVTGGGGLGYGTGSGGTVTQLTSKSTAVTLNKPTGQITMNGAALAANTAVTFTLNNSLLSANDMLVVTLSASGSGYTPIAYNVWALTSNGISSIYLKNISAGSLSEAVVISFAIIKGATS